MFRGSYCFFGCVEFLGWYVCIILYFTCLSCSAGLRKLKDDTHFSCWNFGASVLDAIGLSWVYVLLGLLREFISDRR